MARSGTANAARVRASAGAAKDPIGATQSHPLLGMWPPPLASPARTHG